MGKLNLNDRHKEVLDIFLKNDFDKDEVSFDQGINPITMARFFQLINNLYYDKEDQIVSHSDVSEALSDALDWLVSEKERTGEGIRGCKNGTRRNDQRQADEIKDDECEQ